MFLSYLLVDTGDNPDRPRPGRAWLRNRYRVHQRLCMAFPSADRKRTDAGFQKPVHPETIWRDFGPQGQHVHVPRREDAGFLFRVDPLLGGRAMIVVQSALSPDWDYAFHNAGYLLAARPEVKPFNPDFPPGAVVHFRLEANPTRRVRAETRERNGEKVKDKWVGKRIPVPTDKLGEWLARQGQRAGFVVRPDGLFIQPGYVYVGRNEYDFDPTPPRPPQRKGVRLLSDRLRSARYEGVLDVVDPDGFRRALTQGIGPGKGFGFGLLSVVKVT